MKYFVVEIQKLDENTYAHIVHEAATRNEAESKYHQVLAAAAISNIPQHSAIMFSAVGFPLMHESYEHVVVPVVVPEEEIPAE